MYLTEKLANNIASPEQVIKPDWLGAQNFQLSIKRDDLLHPIISGNKWRKLKYALVDASEEQIKHIISFGGGFSNHLHALGYCCFQLNIKFTAIVRGDYSQNLSPMLQDLLHWNTEIDYVDRLTYKRRDSADYLALLEENHPNAMIIPEGGSQNLALKGVAEIISELNQTYDYIIAPVASGGTLAGLIQGVAEHSPKTKILGIAVLRGQTYLEQLVTDLLANNFVGLDWQINHDYHFGGYAKTNSELKAFCEYFYRQNKIRIEPVYSGKLFYAVKTLVSQSLLPEGSKILILHTGGLQGAR
jgi:1-aminocyclopropane-1-carboxylate deaminase